MYEFTFSRLLKKYFGPGRQSGAALEIGVFGIFSLPACRIIPPIRSIQ